MPSANACSDLGAISIFWEGLRSILNDMTCNTVSDLYISLTFAVQYEGEILLKVWYYAAKHHDAASHTSDTCQRLQFTVPFFSAMTGLYSSSLKISG
jgi:hypothetical protein